MIHENGFIIDLNQTFAKILGYEYADDLIGKEAIEIIPFTSESKLFVYEHFKSKSDATFDVEIIRQDGKIIPCETRGSEIVYKGRRANLVYIRDISDRKKAEKDLIESEERYRKLIEAFPDIIMVSDLKGNIIYANEPLNKITGILPDDYKNQDRKAHIYPDDYHIVSDALKDLLISDKAHTDLIENRFIDSWGKLHWFSGIMAKTFFEGELFILTVSRDITDKKSIEKELENYRNNLEILVKERTDELAAINEELNATNEELSNQREELQASLNKLHETQKQLVQAEKMASLGILSAGIAHEINNPLNFIQGGIEGLESYFNQNLKDHLENVEIFLNSIQVGVSRASGIVTGLSHYSRHNDDKKSDCNIHEIIDDSLLMLNHQLKNRIEVQKQYTEKPFIFEGNEGKLHQAFLNILTNAVHAIADKGKISIITKIQEKVIHIEINDTGQGISPDNLKKIFDPFFTTMEPGKGTGLGLSITYSIIQEHKGNIEYESQQGKGTKVTLKFPLNKL
jgi:PAS domain S-box-containing protein